MPRRHRTWHLSGAACTAVRHGLTATVGLGDGAPADAAHGPEVQPLHPWVLDLPVPRWRRGHAPPAQNMAPVWGGVHSGEAWPHRYCGGWGMEHRPVQGMAQRCSLPIPGCWTSPSHSGGGAMPRAGTEHGTGLGWHAQRYGMASPLLWGWGMEHRPVQSMAQRCRLSTVGCWTSPSHSGGGAMPRRYRAHHRCRTTSLHSPKTTAAPAMKQAPQVERRGQAVTRCRLRRPRLPRPRGPGWRASWSW